MVLIQAMEKLRNLEGTQQILVWNPCSFWLCQY